MENEEQKLLKSLDDLRARIKGTKEEIRSLELLELEQVITTPRPISTDFSITEDSEDENLFEDQVAYYLSNLENIETESEEELLYLLPTPDTKNFDNLLLRLKLETIRKIKAINDLVCEDDTLTLEDLTFVKEQIDINKRLLTVIDKYMQEPELIAENTQNKLILVPSTTGKITPLEHLKNIPIDLYPSITSLLESIKNGTFKNVRHFFTGSISEVRDLSRGTRILFDRVGPDSYAVIGILVKKTQQNSAYRERTSNLARNYQTVLPGLKTAMMEDGFEEERTFQEKCLWEALKTDDKEKRGNSYGKNRRKSK